MTGSEHRRGEAGFTLIELIVTLTILGLSLAVIASYRSPTSGSLGIRGAAEELAAGLRLARSEAIVRNRPVAFQLDLPDRRYRIGDKPPRQLPKELTLGLLTVAGEQRGRDVGNIRFNPDGGSTGGRIAITNGQRTIAVGVDWLTGRVSLADVR